MSKARSLDARLAKLRSVRGEPTSPNVVRELRAALGDSANLIVAEAAAMVCQARLSQLEPEMVAAFNRLFEDPVRNDKLCQAKTVLADTLYQLELGSEELFWRGARHVQLEPVWGGQQDTAAGLRVICALALVRTRAQGVLAYLVDLIADGEKVARIGAVQALAYSELPAAELLIRLKARLGDPEPEVIGECFQSLLKMSGAGAVPFVAEYLKSKDLAIQESAILALGDSRRREAYELLKSFWERLSEQRLQEAVLMALSLLRLPPATDFLLEIIASQPRSVASAALAALALHRYDERLRERVSAAVLRNGHAALQAELIQRFHQDS